MKFAFVIVLCLIPMLHGANNDEKEKPTNVEDVCEFDCMTDLYNEYCGGAECVYGTKTPEQAEAMCSDKCLDVVLGAPGMRCIEINHPKGSDTADFVDFLKEGIYEFCFFGAKPSEEAPSSEEAYLSYLFEQEALDLVDEGGEVY